MVKRAASKSNPSNYPGVSGSTGSGYSKDSEKIKKIEGKLAIMKQEMNKRGYMP